MKNQTYLMKSRHGIYYLRLVIPMSDQSHPTRRRREIRISLRTKDKAHAKLRYAEKVYLLNRPTPLDPNEIKADREQALFEKGLSHIERLGHRDLDDPFAWNNLTAELAESDLQAYLFAHDVLQKRNQGTQRPTDAEAIPAHPVQSRSTKPKSLGTDTTFEHELKRFIDQKKQLARRGTAEKYDSQCRLFLRVISDQGTNLRISDLTVDHIRRYMDILPKLPPKISPAKPLPQLPTEGRTISPKTRFSHAQAVNMFLTWCKDQQHPISIDFSAILKPLLKKPKQRHREKGYTEPELIDLFSSEQYHNGTFKRASDYWVPLLGLFTGARESELCQLTAEDIRLDLTTGIWIIDIHERNDNHLKNEPSRRVVPIHPTLEMLGLTSYVQSISRGKLFPEDRPNKRGEYSAFSKRYNRYKESFGIKSTKDQKKDFHSFRHTVSTRLIGLGVEEYIANAICGHQNSTRTETLHTYANGPNLAKKYEAVSRLEYPIDFKKIKPNGWLKNS